MIASQSIRIVNDRAGAAILLEPTRLRLVRELAEPASASQLSRRLGEPRQRINYHLKELEKAGLVELVEERRKGNCVERVVVATASAYLISPEVLGVLSADPSKVADRFSSAYLVAVCAETIREVGTLRDRAERAGKKLPTLTVQTEIRFSSAQAMSDAARELTETITRIAAKYHDESAPTGRLFKIHLAGYPAITKKEDGTPIAERGGAPQETAS